MFAIDLTRARRLAFGLVLGQAAVTAAVALVSLAIAGPRAAQSALLGGGISVLASLAMALVVFGRAGASAERTLGAFYLGEALKVAVVVALFVVVLRLIKTSPAAMFTAYAATFLVYWIALAIALPALGGTRQLRERHE